MLLPELCTSFDLPLLIPSSGTERSLCGLMCYDSRVFRCCERTQTNTGTVLLGCFFTFKGPLLGESQLNQHW